MVVEWCATSRACIDRRWRCNGAIKDCLGMSERCEGSALNLPQGNDSLDLDLVDEHTSPLRGVGREFRANTVAPTDLWKRFFAALQNDRSEGGQNGEGEGSLGNLRLNG